MWVAKVDGRPGETLEKSDRRGGQKILILALVYGNLYSFAVQHSRLQGRLPLP